MGGGGGTLIFSCIRRLGLFFWGSEFECQYFYVFFFRKLNIFGGMKVFVHKTIRCILGSFLKVKVQNGGYFLVC